MTGRGRARTRQEDGTVAVVAAVCSLLLFATAALAVDLGAASARKRDIQTQADLAVLAAAAKLPGPNAAVLAAANDYAQKNAVAGQTTWNFTETPDADGYLEYDGPDKVRLVAPSARVDFSLAPVVGLPDHTEVAAVAAAQIETPGGGLPFFVSQTCGWGAQTILDPPSGPPSSDPAYVPTLTPAGASSKAKLSTLSPQSAALNATPFALTIDVQGNLNNVVFDGATKNVAFTTESGNHVTLAGAKVNNGRLQVTVPASVLSVEKVWWVRLIDEDAALTATYLKFVVGSPVATDTASCAGKNSGNFGSLDLSRNPNSNATNLEYNLQFGIQHELDEWAGPPYPASCAGDPGAVVDNGTPTAARKLNCLTTDTGSDLRQKATAAFIKNSNARLLDSANPSHCANTRSVSVSGTYTINNDPLSCFFTKDTTTVAGVTGPAVAAADVHSLSDAIFDSPRFFYIPVLVDDPSHGRSGSYAVVTMRPVFITEQGDAGTKLSPQVTANNGIEIASNKIDKVKIRVLNPDALPEFVAGDIEESMSYIGTGTKLVRLVE